MNEFDFSPSYVCGYVGKNAFSLRVTPNFDEEIPLVHLFALFCLVG